MVTSTASFILISCGTRDILSSTGVRLLYLSLSQCRPRSKYLKKIVMLSLRVAVSHITYSKESLAHEFASCSKTTRQYLHISLIVVATVHIGRCKVLLAKCHWVLFVTTYASRNFLQITFTRTVSGLTWEPSEPLNFPILPFTLSCCSSYFSYFASKNFSEVANLPFIFPFFPILHTTVCVHAVYRAVFHLVTGKLHFCTY